MAMENIITRQDQVSINPSIEGDPKIDIFYSILFIFEWLLPHFLYSFGGSYSLESNHCQKWA